MTNVMEQNIGNARSFRSDYCEFGPWHLGLVKYNGVMGVTEKGQGVISSLDKRPRQKMFIYW